ncbi:hypothetical protein [Stenotrophomonas lactitubi]|uniref:hypothetical protein n=1 Tax=Stenotrophomonas lactitubi TaxID=2045214 RepID=UPI00320B6F8D
MLRIGPILSFRGQVEQRWRVTVLIGVSRAQPPPELDLNGAPSEPPTLLYGGPQDAYWRYDVSIQLHQAERSLSYGIEDQDARWSFTVPARDHPKLSLTEVLLDNLGHDHVLNSNADDLRDHWSHDDHEGERKRLIETLLHLGEKKRLRTCIVSGDVHVAARSGIYRQDTPPAASWAQIHPFASSAIVHPSMVGVMERLFLQLINRTAAKAQAIDVQHTVEMMLFPCHHRYVMAARNWLAPEVDADAQRSQLWATWRCENESGFSNHLQTVPAAVLN